MITNSINSTETTPSVPLNSPQQSLLQIALKLKNIVFDVSL